MAALSRFISRLTDKSHAFFETLKDPKDFQWTDKCEQTLSDLKDYLTTPPLLSKPLEGEVLLLYLAVSEHAVSAVLVREEGRKQHCIYYVSKSLLDAETRYNHLEKLALALVNAARKLRHYFKAHQIVVVTSFPIKAVLHKPEVSGRLAKWAIELGEYDVIFRPATAIKSQVLADFVAEFSPVMLPALEQEVKLRDSEGEKGEWTLYVDWSTPRHPQSNGQAESTNKTVVNMLKKCLEDAHGRWAEELHRVLWVYRTTPKTATQETSFSLVYCAEAVIPTEVHIRTTVSEFLSEEENNELMSLSLDLLDEKREAARLINVSYQLKVAKSYNKKVRYSTF
ncbi:uncharacterized protein LOC130508553 [Raphanus sativus]|uniref:Uncharacterized protein LOC130508553 n=1 Tax=Raphanus sativus TaxID=3726 RepID=A0A9W3D8S2_RAPSA|nr:uncharacterized protein LOC130508553 [Raphanus sativus]